VSSRHGNGFPENAKAQRISAIFIPPTGSSSDPSIGPTQGPAPLKALNEGGDRGADLGARNLLGL
jgi:hypothetical protein